MIVDYGKWYPVDGESFAHGKARDIEFTLEYDDIYEPVFSALEIESDRVTIEGVDFSIYDFLSYEELTILEGLKEQELIDDDYGTAKHEVLIGDFLEEYLDKKIQICFEDTEMV